jgi:hypothetical protein
MRGTIDQVDAFFSAISSVWGRAFSFFAICWLGFVVGIITASAEWRAGEGLSLYVQGGVENWFLVPIAWMFNSLAVCDNWWGLPHLLFLVVVAFLLFFTDFDLFETICVAFLVESWFWWWAAGPGDNEYYFASHWHPLFPILLVVTFFFASACVRSWKRNHSGD